MSDLASQIIVLSTAVGLAVAVVVRQNIAETKLKETTAKKYQALLDKINYFPKQIKDTIDEFNRAQTNLDDLKLQDVKNRLEEIRQDMLRFIKGLNTLNGNVFEGKDSLQNQITRLEEKLQALKDRMNNMERWRND
jgi:DNA repair exonuclease SbcCD ATPase subunit